MEVDAAHFSIPAATLLEVINFYGLLFHFEHLKWMCNNDECWHLYCFKKMKLQPFFPYLFWSRLAGVKMILCLRAETPSLDHFYIATNRHMQCESSSSSRQIMGARIGFGENDTSRYLRVDSGLSRTTVFALTNFRDMFEFLRM